MEALLQRLYHGQLAPAEQYRPRQEEHRQLLEQFYRRYEGFTKELEGIDPSLGKRFTQIMDEQFEAIPLEESEIFIDGFRLGAGMMIEVLYSVPGRE